MAVQGTVIHRPWVAKVASLALIVVGVFLLKTCVLDVLADAQAHAPEVKLSFRGVFIAPASLMGGVFATYAAFLGKQPAAAHGERSRFVHPDTKRLTPIGWVLAIACLAPGLALYMWLRSQLAAMGYDV
jgi:hypothetical protein